MRTTIEIRDDHRAALLELAAKRGLKGFSPLVDEALEAYLKSGPADRRRLAEGLRGAISSTEAAGLRRRTKAIRRSWR